jgi:hypothetical protein
MRTCTAGAKLGLHSYALPPYTQTFDDHTGKLLLQTVYWLNLQLALFVCF